MAEPTAVNPAYLSLSQRVVALGLYIAILVPVSGTLTGTWLPTAGGETLWLACAIGLWAFSLLSSPFFVPPSQALANAIGALLVLLALDLHGVTKLQTELDIARWVFVGGSTLAVLASVVAIGLRNARQKGKVSEKKVERLAYRLATNLGKGPIQFTPPALLSIVGFQQDDLTALLLLAFVWVFLATLRPVELFFRLWNDFKEIAADFGTALSVGVITRIDDPGLIRVALDKKDTWTPDEVHSAHLQDGRVVEVLPLFVQTQPEGLIGTGICNLQSTVDAPAALGAGEVALPGERRDAGDVLSALFGEATAPKLVGFVVEHSTISQIRFEVAPDSGIREGALVAAKAGDDIVYYQVVEAQTAEEMFSQNPRGTHIVTASQLGTHNPDGGFAKYGWVPRMNSAVFAVTSARSQEPAQEHPGEFSLGVVPGSTIPVRASIEDLAFYHTAILGVTGTGKTETALEIIGHALAADFKVFCVDFTGEYLPRLEKEKPEVLSFSTDQMSKLGSLIADVEFGEYGAPNEKKKLDEWVTSARPEVDQKVAAFLGADGSALGIFDLPEITNSRATLRATEIYISAIFKWAKTNRQAKKILVVLEEAHTVIPEHGGFSFDKGETSAVVSRISQIALQGRKYGVGLLLVSQRTALVSKTLLSQCNTCISFALYDKTGLDYLASTHTPQHVAAIPNLRFLQGVATGRAIKSDRPIIFEAPFDEEKKAASDRLRAAPPPTPAVTAAASDAEEVDPPGSDEHEEQGPEVIEPNDAPDDDVPF